MRLHRWLPTAIVLALLPVSLAQATAPAPPAAARSSVSAGGYLRHADRLVSPHGRYSAGFDAAGRFGVRSPQGTVLWQTPANGPAAYLHLSSTGQLAVEVAGRARWLARTGGSGPHDVLALRDDGELALTSGGLTVWSTRLPYACPDTPAKVFVVDISKQWARMCEHHQQLRATWVTTGADTARDRTPTGTWHVYARIRDTTLYPTDGGAYRVRYWMPYYGAYGMHDASWQRFAYGSSLRRTRGSQGCVHVPLPMMAWLYAWAPVGTRVTVHA